jgi:hypothetical protein
MHITTIVLLFGLFGLLAALPAPQLLEVPASRDHAISALKCDDEDLLQKLQDVEKISSASVFYSSFLQANVGVPASTFALTTPTTPTIAERKVLTTYTADTVEERTTSSSLNVTSLATPFSTPAPNRGDGAPYPAWLPTTNEVSRVSSACSCIINNSTPSITTHDAQATGSSVNGTVAAVSSPSPITTP